MTAPTFDLGGSLRRVHGNDPIDLLTLERIPALPIVVLTLADGRRVVVEGYTEVVDCYGGFEATNVDFSKPFECGLMTHDAFIVGLHSETKINDMTRPFFSFFEEEGRGPFEVVEVVDGTLTVRDDVGRFIRAIDGGRA